MKHIKWNQRCESFGPFGTLNQKNVKAYKELESVEIDFCLKIFIWIYNLLPSFCSMEQNEL